MQDRRVHNRREARVVINIDAPDRSDRAGITRDVSPGGVLFHSASRFHVGDALRMRFLNAPVDETLEVVGTVVRTAQESPFVVLRHLAAVRFDAPVSQLAL